MVLTTLFWEMLSNHTFYNIFENNVVKDIGFTVSENNVAKNNDFTTFTKEILRTSLVPATLSLERLTLKLLNNSCSEEM